MWATVSGGLALFLEKMLILQSVGGTTWRGSMEGSSKGGADEGAAFLYMAGLMEGP